MNIDKTEVNDYNEIESINKAIEKYERNPEKKFFLRISYRKIPDKLISHPNSGTICK